MTLVAVTVYLEIFMHGYCCNGRIKGWICGAPFLGCRTKMWKIGYVIMYPILCLLNIVTHCLQGL